MSDPTRFSPTGKTDAFGNKYVQGNDGRYYKTDGKSYWETPETRRIREAEESSRTENTESFFEDNGPSVGQIWDDGVQEIAEEFRSSGRKAAKGILGIFIAILAAVGIGTFSSEYSKESQNAVFAVKKAGRNIACIVGMLVIELVLLLIVFLTGQASGIGRVVVDAVLLAGHYSVFGLIRVMRNKTFLIHVKFNDPAARPFPIWVYIVIEIVSVILLTNLILERINEAVSGMYDDLTVLTDDQVIRLGIGMLAASVLLAIVSGLLICMVVKFLKKHIRIY